MPRPSKRVSPDTLGGRIRAARQNLRLSLKEVAGQKYSTSLISQIERNRVEPSQESLQYLADQLKLPLDELVVLAQQHRESEAEGSKYKASEEQRSQAAQLLEAGRPRSALEQLNNLNISQIFSSLRWRMFALRGQCYFTLRQFLDAQKDFLSAEAVLPEKFPPEQYLEALTLRLHLAAATRELGQLDTALVEYQAVLKMMNPSTPLRYVAEAHWGMALVIFGQADDESDEIDQPRSESLHMQDALRHAEDAAVLYRSIGETLRASLLDCQIGLIEQAMGNLNGARQRLRRVLDTWIPTLDESVNTTPYSPKERANVVSAAACYLAGVELEDSNCQVARTYVEQALEAGRQSYILRQAEAQMMLGQILEHINIQDPKAEEAFRDAIKVLANTDRLGAQIRAHDLLGRHLMKKGLAKEGDRELDIARKLSNAPTNFSSATSSAEDTPQNK
jgi:transcriptional regulator with XRE-family HTH domain